MSLDSTYREFSEKYLNDNKDIFEGILKWCDDSRKLQNKSFNCLSTSESLSACIGGKLPDNLKKRKPVDVVNREYAKKYIDEILCYVYDEDVKNSVIRSLIISKHSSSLEFYYFKDLDSGQKSQVRILSRILWNDLFMKLN